MPYKMFYLTISAEVLRICRATSNYSFFLDSVKKLISRKSADTVGIKKVVTKMMCRHWQPFEKFDLSLEQIASDIYHIVKLYLKVNAVFLYVCSVKFIID